MSDSVDFSPDPAAASRPSSRRFIKRPDDHAFKQRAAEIRALIARTDAALADIDAKLAALAMPAKASDRRRQLQAELKTLIAKQAALKSERGAIMDQVKVIDHEIKRRVAEKNALIPAKYSFKSGADVDARINHLDLLISAGTANLADERRFVKELSSLRKVRKDFIAVEKIQAVIDADRAKIAALKAKAADTHNKALQAEFETVQAELSALSASNDAVSKTRDGLYNTLRALRKEKAAHYDALNKNRAEQDAAFAKFKQQLEEERRRYEEESKLELAAAKTRRRREAAQKELDAASVPAFSHEIDQIHTVLQYFDPLFVRPAPAVAGAYDPRAAAAPASSRKVEMPSDCVVLKKEKADFFAGSKGKKAPSKAKAAKRFTVDPAIIVALGDLSIAFPTREDEVPATVAVLQETLLALRDKQDEQTRINIERARQRVAAAEAAEDEAEAAQSESPQGESAQGESAQDEPQQKDVPEKAAEDTPAEDTPA